MRRLTDKEFEALMSEPKVLQAMSIRCEEQGHSWENCCSAVLRIYMRCKWCGAEK